MAKSGDWLLVYEVWDCTGAFRHSEIIRLEGNHKRAQRLPARKLAREAFEDAKRNPSLNSPTRLPHNAQIALTLRNPKLRYEERLETDTA